MSTRKADGEDRWIVHLDDSPESDRLREVLKDYEGEYRVMESSTSVSPLPALETPFELITGYKDLLRYFAPLRRR